MALDLHRIVTQCEDHLFRFGKFTVRERALYYHLLRLTHVEGRATRLVAILPLAQSMGVAESSVREDIRALHERGFVVIEDRSRNGHLVRVVLPEEVPGALPPPPEVPDVDIESADVFTGRRYLRALLAREDGRCFYCLKAVKPESCELDHVVPRANGLNNTYRNVVCACHDCNTQKQAQPASDFVRSLYRKGVLSQDELAGRLTALDELQSGLLLPDLSRSFGS